MPNRLFALALAATVLFAAAATTVAASEKELPAGPIRDRHELMEGIGKNAKLIGDSLKSGNLEPIGGAAEEIQAASGKVADLFPKGSTHPDSRAMPAIWEKWDRFEELCAELGIKAGQLATTARGGGDLAAIKTAANMMYGNCKSCHDDFRKPEEKEGQ